MAAAASTTYFGRKNHRYFSGETDIPTPTNLTFEFNEFDVWNVASSPEFHKTVSASRISNKSPSTAIQKAALSLPVDVPDWSMILKNELIKNRTTAGIDDDDLDIDMYGDDDNLIPPHEYLARGRTMSFSVHEGIGRTLKGRDLSRVRNAVWKQIGFED
ncbi:uncharacterized protein LOC110890908 isoform X1 [Helianthus annuus]|uniref:uncharacterized protein LOC110890908 isoform X1 n=1 Tax=Helianthus annuus TaxID=4232 RepID=UPI000B8F4FD2|nr:uncharacterized protein LOC110890908 isoform X1 [Helianthus annuus]